MSANDDIQRAARHFIRRYGDDAPRQATMRAEELRAAGHLEAQILWESICRAITVLLSTSADTSKQ